MLSLKNSLHILNNNLFSDVFCKHFLPGVPFFSSLSWQHLCRGVFNFNEVHFINYFSHRLLFSVIFKKSLPCPRSSRFSPRHCILISSVFLKANGLQKENKGVYTRQVSHYFLFIVVSPKTKIQFGTSRNTYTMTWMNEWKWSFQSEFKLPPITDTQLASRTHFRPPSEQLRPRSRSAAPPLLLFLAPQAAGGSFLGAVRGPGCPRLGQPRDPRRKRTER